MSVVRTCNVDQIDISPLDELPPICFHRLVAPILGKPYYTLRISRTDRLQHRLIGHIKKTRRLKERVRVRAPHESVSNQADIEILPCHSRSHFSSLSPSREHLVQRSAFQEHPAMCLARSSSRSGTCSHPNRCAGRRESG